MRPDRKRLLERQPRDEGRFSQTGSEPLSKRVRGVRLPQSIDDAIENHLAQSDQSEWLRKVITEAAERELMLQQDVS